MTKSHPPEGNDVPVLFAVHSVASVVKVQSDNYHTPVARVCSARFRAPPPLSYGMYLPNHSEFLRSIVNAMSVTISTLSVPSLSHSLFFIHIKTFPGCTVAVLKFPNS